MIMFTAIRDGTECQKPCLPPVSGGEVRASEGCESVWGEEWVWGVHVCVGECDV